MGKGDRFTEELRVEAVKQVAERGLRLVMSANGWGSAPTGCMSGLSATGFRPRNGQPRKIRPDGSKS